MIQHLKFEAFENSNPVAAWAAVADQRRVHACVVNYVEMEWNQHCALKFVHFETSTVTFNDLNLSKTKTEMD